MENNIVLGFPYAGAFVWLLNAERQYNKSIKDKYDGSHPYYITLFGENHNLIIDQTVSLTLLFEKIYLAPVDIYLPDSEKYQSDSMYANTDLGIYTNWDWVEDIKVLYNQINPLLKDIIIQDFFKNVNKESQVQIMLEAINQIHVSLQHDSPIFGIPEYIKLCQRVNQLVFSGSVLKTQESTLPLSALSTVFDLASLIFSIKNIEEFSHLRQDKEVTNYALSFKEYIKSLPDGTANKNFLYESMLKAMNTHSIADKISGGFSLTATLSGGISFIPPAAIIGGIAGLAADGISRLAGNVSAKNKWWLFAPGIAEKLTKHRVEILYNETKGSR
jgi:hypothetical protein